MTVAGGEKLLHSGETDGRDLVPSKHIHQQHSQRAIREKRMMVIKQVEMSSPVPECLTGILLTCPVFFKAEKKMEGHHDERMEGY